MEERGEFVGKKDGRGSRQAENKAQSPGAV